MKKIPSRLSTVVVLYGAFVLSLSARAGEADLTLYPRTSGEIKAHLQMLAPARGAAASMQNQYIQRLKQYRYVVGVPYEGLHWDDDKAVLAQHASLICSMLNKLTHSPEKPAGMSDAEYDLCKKGCGQSNLFAGVTKPTACVDGWMDDSDKGNIDRVGHRRWCINPPMLKSAFGADGKYAAMYAFDGSNKSVPDWDFVAYPARGYMPMELFGNRHAWSCSLNSKKYGKVSKESIKVEIHAADVKLAPTGPPLKLDYFNVNTDGYGTGPAVIFRPESLQMKADAIYVVDITGASPPIHYIVHFIDVARVPNGPEVAAAYTKFYQQRLNDIQALPDRLDKLEALSDLSEDENIRLADASISKNLNATMLELLKEKDLRHELDAYVKTRVLTDLVQQAAKPKSTVSKQQVAVAYQNYVQAYKGTRWGTKAAAELEKLKKEMGAAN